MGAILVAIRLPFFLIAEVTLWYTAAFGYHVLFLNRISEAIEQHKRLVDWLRGIPRDTKS
jgi:hypothetical protein